MSPSLSHSTYNPHSIPMHSILSQDSTLREVNGDAPLTLESPAPKKHHLISQLSLNIVLSPRRELALRSSVPFTPCGDKANTFCYYCPLCMEFFESILKTKCCKNYICLACTLEYLNAKGLLAQSVKEVVGNVSLKTMSCPHCLTIGFDPQLVESEESIRDYSHPQLGQLYFYYIFFRFFLSVFNNLFLKSLFVHFCQHQRLSCSFLYDLMVLSCWCGNFFSCDSIIFGLDRHF